MTRIERILAPNPGVYTLEGTNTWVVGDEPSIVIDPGPDDDEHLWEVARCAGRVGAVLVTHDHPDHAPGATAFARMVRAPLFAFRLKGAEQLAPGRPIEAGDVELETLHTPGHTSDHVSFWFEKERSLFTGDTVLGRGTSFIDPPDGELKQYMRSLRRILDLHPRTIYPGHGPVVLDGESTVRGYLDHREERERQILEQLKDGPRSIEDIVAVIYADHPKDVHELAGRSVLAHLIKLEADGTVDHAGKGATARYSIVEPRACARCGRPVRGRARYCPSCSLLLLQQGETAGDQAGS